MTGPGVHHQLGFYFTAILLGNDRLNIGFGIVDLNRDLGMGFFDLIKFTVELKLYFIIKLVMYFLF